MHLDDRLRTTICRVGDRLFPGDASMPSFSASGSIEASARFLAGLPAADRRLLEAALRVLSFSPDSVAGGLLAAREGGGGIAPLQKLASGLESLVSMSYYASMPWPAESPSVDAIALHDASARATPDAGSVAAVEPSPGPGTHVRRRLVVLGTLDTRGDEVAVVQEMIEARGHEAIVIDMGVVGTPEGTATHARDEVARAGGKSIEELVAAANAGADRGDATDVMVAGARKIVTELAAADKVDGILGIGGSTASSSASRVMHALPVGIPKVLLTTFMKGDTKDIVVLESPVDLVGLNRVVMRALAQAVGAVCGMAEQVAPAGIDRPLVALTALGVTTPAVMKVIARLDEIGFDAVVFAATTEKLEAMARDGAFIAIIDITSFEMLGKVFYSDQQIQDATGATSVDRRRLPSAEALRLPQVIAPGGLDIHIIPGMRDAEALPDALKGRPHAKHGPDIMLVRTGPLEMQLLGHALARRVERATAPIAVVLPKRGFSDASRRGTPMNDPDADQMFIDVFTASVDDVDRIREVDCHINDDAFADAVIDAFRSLVGGARSRVDCIG